MKEERIYINSFWETSISLIPDLAKHIAKKENYRPVSLMSQVQNSLTNNQQINSNNIENN